MRDAHPAKRIAIVGGGISGLALAKFLRDVDSDRRRFELHLFDTGERACGGRASSKALAGVDVDHGLQYFTLSSDCLLYTSPSPRDYAASRMPSSA